MRILMIQPNYYSGGAEIAGHWPAGWVPYIGGALKHAGYTEVLYKGAMVDETSDEDLRAYIARHQPDVVMATAITPMVYKAQTTLQVAKEACPNAITILGGIHPTFMYAQVFQDAPWIDYVVRGEGERIIINLLRVISDGTHKALRREIRGIAFLDGNGEVVATPAEPVIENLDELTPDWSLLEWDKYIYTPLYDLGRVKHKGGVNTDTDLGFDESKILSRGQIAQLQVERPDLSADIDFRGVRSRKSETAPAMSACDPPNDLKVDAQQAVAETR